MEKVNNKVSPVNYHYGIYEKCIIDGMTEEKARETAIKYAMTMCLYNRDRKCVFTGNLCCGNCEFISSIDIKNI